MLLLPRSGSELTARQPHKVYLPGLDGALLPVMRDQSWMKLEEPPSRVDRHHQKRPLPPKMSGWTKIRLQLYEYVSHQTRYTEFSAHVDHMKEELGYMLRTMRYKTTTRGLYECYNQLHPPNMLGSYSKRDSRLLSLTWPHTHSSSHGRRYTPTDTCFHRRMPIYRSGS